VCRSESLSAESRSVQSSTGYRLTKSRSESDLSQPESDEEGCNLSGRRNIDLDLAFSQKKKGNALTEHLCCWWNGNNPPNSFLFSAPSADFVVAGWNKVSQEEPSNRYPESSP
uniref:Uncharacterized protein n=1 Tax=Oryzias latipes TaxID=8090 RepID=A0A3P9JYP3_ORYLA